MFQGTIGTKPNKEGACREMKQLTSWRVDKTIEKEAVNGFLRSKVRWNQGIEENKTIQRAGGYVSLMCRDSLISAQSVFTC